tara:strand:+ start:2283 stop:3023 length:741 start_codon:yes stop_codon:yes gene_type:complete
MKYKREDRVKILEYKFIFEEELQVKNEYEEGNADLNYRLSFFRKKLHDQKVPQEEKDRYDKTFMGNVSSNDPHITDITTPDTPGLTQSANKASNDIKPWAKKLYRQIVMVTHPDKTLEIPSEHLRQQLTNQYRITQNAYSEELYSDLLMVGFDLNLSLPDNVVDEEITPTSNFKKENISKIKSLIAWQWYHVPPEQKDAELKKILAHMGFEFKDSDVKNVVKRRYVKRKTGTRPHNLRRNRRNSLK